MKLLTTTGLLYSVVSSQTVDGHKGAFTQIDWAVTLPEQATSVTNLGTQAGAPTVGWNPNVQAVLATYDGGKLVAGFGKLTGTVYDGWVIKMFGSTGTKNCGTGSKVTGYATLTYSINSAVATPSECLTETQWTYGSLTDQMSTIYLGVVEEYKVGAGGGAGVDPWYYVVGATQSYANYGMGNWVAIANALTFAGLDVAGQTANTAAIENTHRNGLLLTSEKMESQILATNGCYTSIDMVYSSQNVAVGGFTGSSHTCIQYALDRNVISGTALAYEFATKVFTVNGATAPATTGSFTPPSTHFANVNGQGAGANAGVITMAQTDPNTGDVYILLSSNEFYSDSYLVGLTAADFAVEVPKALAKASYGAIYAFYGSDATQTADSNLVTSAWDHMNWVGNLGGKGIIGSGTVSGPTLTLSTSVMSDTTYCASGVCSIDPPTGGVAQFKGLSYGTTEGKYVDMQCNGIQPMFYTTAWQNLAAGTGNGWMVTCMTGIGNCEASLADQATALTPAEVTTCLLDPRYQTWRMMNIKYLYIGTQVWFRTDSYWNAASTEAASTWGPGIKLSANYASAADNNGTTNVGKTYVFAYSDGSGVQLNHLTFATVAPTSNSTAGTGTNQILTGPTQFYTNSPHKVSENFCSTTNIMLEGTTDTSGLGSSILAYSDGYKGVSTLSLEFILTGAQGGWRGMCIVMYSSQYIQDGTNGALCHAAIQSSAGGAGPIDFGASYLLHVPASTWSPPAKTGSVTPSALSLTDSKYGVSYNPSSSTSYLMTEGFYASATWYQPKTASSYTLVARYGKDDFVGSYCLQGSGSTSYFDAPGGSMQFTGAATLAAGVLALGSALSLAM